MITGFKPTFHEESNIVAIAVALAVGIGFYFTIPQEIPISFTIITGMCLLAILLRFSKVHQVLHQSLLYGLVCLIGFIVADARTDRVAAPVLAEVGGYYSVQGTVDERQVDSKGRDRLVVTELEIKGLSPDQTPSKIRVQVRTHIDDKLAPGDRVLFDANLSAPQGPVAAGSFNFARKAWFDQFGGVGFAVSDIEAISTSSPQSSSLNEIRHSVGQRLAKQMSAKEAALATALLTGDRSALPPDVVDQMRDAGLAHLLAISGLHMGLVTATIFFVIEALLSLVPAVALRIPPAKIAAIFAGVSALG